MHRVYFAKLNRCFAKLGGLFCRIGDRPVAWPNASLKHTLHLGLIFLK